MSYSSKSHLIDPTELYFGQQHIYTVSFFKYPWHTINIQELPHFKLLNGNEEYYMEYLKLSWNYYNVENNEENRQNKIDRYYKLYYDIMKNGVSKPVEYFIRPDNKKILVDGNHRASIACFIGKPIPGIKISMKDYIYRNIKRSKAIYGTGRNGLPYT